MSKRPEPTGILPATLENIHCAAEHSCGGDLVIVPTETVYGIAVRPDHPDAMARLYAAKGREESKRVATFALDIDSVRDFGIQVPTAAERLAKAFWPGPLTMVLQNPEGEWDGFRVPDHPVTLAWLRQLDFLPAVTSANRSGEPAACTAQAAWDALCPYVALALDDGPSPQGVASTVVRVAMDFIEILREGPIDCESLVRAAGCSARG